MSRKILVIVSYGSSMIDSVSSAITYNTTPLDTKIEEHIVSPYDTIFDALCDGWELLGAPLEITSGRYKWYLKK
jgi:hypothetical protein